MSRTTDIKQLAKIARMYYEEDMTQAAIARKLNMSRSLVSKLLTKARDKGIVKITICDESNRPYQEMENYLKKIFGLSTVIVIAEAQEHSRHEIALEAGRYLIMRLADINTVAVSPGRMIREIADNISVNKSYFHATFVPMAGGLSKEYSKVEPNCISEIFAMKFGAKNMRMHTPIIVDSVDAKEILQRQHFVRTVLDTAKSADIALVGIGSTFRYAEVREAYLHGYDKSDTLDSNIVKGDLSYNYFDKNGELFDCKWNHLLMGLNLDDIRKIPEVICAASEIEKTESIYIAAKYNLIDTLIITEPIAQRLLWYRTKEWKGN